LDPPAFVDVFPFVLEVVVVPATKTGVEDPTATVPLEVGAVPARIGGLVGALVAAV
jgi:hypothetical protein